MKKAALVLLTTLFVFICANSYPRAGAEEHGWQEYKSGHFVIYYHKEIPLEYIKEFSQKCERYYSVITGRLGFVRFNFWLWENRAKIFVYNTREDYAAETNRPEYSGASAHVKKKFIDTFYFEKGFFDNVLPHELSHIILREFIGTETKAPLWFDEGVACANEKSSPAKYLAPVKKLSEEGKFVSVSEMENTDQPAWLFYSTSASLVIFMLDTYNKNRFTEFCRELRDGKAFYAAMERVYGIKNDFKLTERFLAYLASKSNEEITGSDGSFAQ